MYINSCKLLKTYKLALMDKVANNEKLVRLLNYK